MGIKWLTTLVDVYGHWEYSIVSLIVAVVYFLLFRFLITSSNYGIVLITLPTFLVILLIMTASILLTVNVYVLRQAFSRSRVTTGVSRGVFSFLSILVGGLSAGCACQAPILFGILYFLGLNSIEASSLVVAFAEYQTWITISIIILNTFLIFLSVLRIAPKQVARGTRAPRVER